MAITSAQQSAVFKLAVGLFNAAPGGFYTEVAGIVVTSMSGGAAADALMATPAFQAIIPSNLLTNEQFAARFVENLVGSTATTANKAWAAAQIVSQINSGSSQGAAAYWAIDALTQVPTNDANWGAAAATLLNKIAVAQHFTVDAPNTSTSLAALQGLLIDVTSDAGSVAVAKANATHNSIELTTSVGETLGTAGADLFKAWLANGANTLQSGDTIRGGAGSDILMADMAAGASAENAIAFTSQSVEKVVLRSQHAAATNNNGDNNLGAAKVAIDAERAAGVNVWENNNSRADLIIEDVRIASNQITKDITIVMRETDPGHVDYGVYFDQNSLRNVSSSTSQINLQVMDTRSVVDGTAPLLNSPYGGFRFTSTNNATGVATVITLQSTAIDNAQTYAQLRDAFQAAADAQFGAGVVNVSIGNNFTVTDTTTGSSVTGQEVVLATSGAFTFTTPTGSGWIANGVVPANSGLHTNFSSGGTTSTALVTSTIILDDVGRGSMGGDLVVGGLSVGDTSTSKGVQRFEITVEDNSKLQHISSTNNTLREVTIVNGATTRLQDAYTTTTTNAGNLTVNGAIPNNTDTALPGTVVDQNRDGDTTDNGENQHGTYGFSDVRLIDGSTMAGKLEFTAEITDASIAKYLNLTDPANNPAADNVAFVYNGGANNDTMTVVIDGSVAGATNTETGREDFTFTISGNNGNDTITLDIGDTETAAWVADQKTLMNVVVDGGDGNDTIKTPGAGRVIIKAGSGNDTVYADNSGTINTKWTINAGAAPVGVDDLQADTLINRFMYKGQLTVAFSGANGATAGGVTAGAADAVAANFTNGYEVTVSIPTDANYNVTQYYLNQAIKAAINGDAVLSKLLVAKDGPASTLIIESLIDGDFAATDLQIGVTSTDVTTYGASEQATILTAFKGWALARNSAVYDSTATMANAQTENALAVTDLNLVNGMLTNGGVLAVDAGTQSAANDSDNIIYLGAGDDVAVLGTGANSNDVLVWTGYSQGKDTIVNFEDNTGVAGQVDLVDFRAYLTGKASASGSTESQRWIQVTLNGDATVEANSITVITGAFNTTTATFSGLTDAKLLAAINSTNTGSADYAGINAGTLNALNTYTGSGAGTTLAGGIGHGIVMVQNNLNEGEYMVFDVTFNGLATNTTSDFSAVTLIGTVDFGNTVTWDATAGTGNIVLHS